MVSSTVAHTAPPSNPTILVADGSPHVRRQVGDILLKLGLRRVHEAGDGAEAIGLLEAVRPDILILDWDITLIGATDILAMTREPSPEGSTGRPVIITMGRPVRSAVERVLALGAAGIVVKPFAARTLRARLDAIRHTRKAPLPEPV